MAVIRVMPGDRVRLATSGHTGILEDRSGLLARVYWGTSDGNRIVTEVEPNELRQVPISEYPRSDG